MNMDYIDVKPSVSTMNEVAFTPPNNSLTRIHRKLDYFIMTGKIPNIIFHGSAGTGKKTIVFNFIDKIYKPKKTNEREQTEEEERNFRNILKKNVMLVNCCHGKGIKFIREELKFFSKMNIQYNEGIYFKSVVLFNADCLTIDAQSALRRCIELFSHNTRFFIVVENIHKLLNPIVSRFCEIYVPETVMYKEKTPPSLIPGQTLQESHLPLTTTQFVNFYQIEIQNTLNELDIQHKNKKREIINDKLNPTTIDNEEKDSTESLHIPVNKQKTPAEWITIVDFFYENGISALDIIEYLEENHSITNEMLLDFHKTKGNYRNEKLLMFRVLWSVK